LLAGRSGGQTLIGSTVTAEDLTLKDNSVDNNTITVTQAIAAYDHIHNLTTDIDHDQLTNFTADEHFTQAGITVVGTVGTGTWEATDVGITHGGTGQSTAQAAIDALTQVSGATNEHVLTKDTDTGNAIWKAAAGGSGDTYVDRGDPSEHDFAETGSKAVLNTDGNWHDLDLSSIVPAGATTVNLRLDVQDDQNGSWIQLRKKGNSYDINVAVLSSQVANIKNYGDVVVSCNADRVIEYQSVNVAFTVIRITVKGWWI